MNIETKIKTDIYKHTNKQTNKQANKKINKQIKNIILINIYIIFIYTHLKMPHNTTNVYIHMIASIFLIVGSINYGACALFDSGLFSVFGPTVEKIIQAAIFIAGLCLMFNRNYYLPFLGRTVMPTSVFKPYVQDNPDKTIEIKTNKETKYVIYWLAQPDKKGGGNPHNYDIAYGDFSNYGISPSVDGKSTLYIKCPQNYNVSYNRTLPKHVHYRFIYNSGMISEIKTKNLESECN